MAMRKALLEKRDDVAAIGVKGGTTTELEEKIAPLLETEKAV